MSDPQMPRLPSRPLHAPVVSGGGIFIVEGQVILRLLDGIQPIAPIVSSTTTPPPPSTTSATRSIRINRSGMP